MKTWKAALIIVGVGILLMAFGFWLGYRYISEQDDIHHQAENTQSNSEILKVSTYRSSKKSFVNI